MVRPLAEERRPIPEQVAAQDDRVPTVQPVITVRLAAARQPEFGDEPRPSRWGSHSTLGQPGGCERLSCIRGIRGAVCVREQLAESILRARPPEIQ